MKELVRRCSVWVVPAALFIHLAWASAVSATRLSWPGVDDTFITFIYARNLAEGHGLVYNAADGEPTEGYSSPLHVLLLAAARRAGLDLYQAALALGIGSFLLVPLLAAAGARAAFRIPLPSALNASLAVQTGLLLWPATALHLNSGMETTLFMAALAGLASWTLAEAAPRGDARRVRPARLAAGVAALALVALARPEGAFLGACALAAIAAARGRDGRGRPAVFTDGTLAACAGSFAVLLSGYLAWKLSYFGYLLPNPYYVKSQHSYLAGPQVALPGLRDTAAFLRAFVPAAVCAGGVLLLFRRVRGRWRALAAAAVPGAIAVALYARFVHEVSFGHRFEYPFLACFIVGLAAAAALAGGTGGGPRFLAVGAVLVAGSVHVASLRFPGRDALRWTELTADGSYGEIGGKPGIDLRRSGLGQRALILLTAAGEIPYRSGFRAIDLVGLNTNELSGRTPMTVERVWDFIERRRPDVIASSLPPAAPEGTPPGADPALRAPIVQLTLGGFGTRMAAYWDKAKLREHTVREMRYIRDRYGLGAAYATAQGPATWLFLYVRKDSPHRFEVLRALADSPSADRTTDLGRYLGNDPRRL